MKYFTITWRDDKSEHQGEITMQTDMPIKSCGKMLRLLKEIFNFFTTGEDQRP